MKKIILLIILTFIIISLAACKNGNNVKKANVQNSTKTNITSDESSNDILAVIDNKIKNINDRKLDRYLSDYVSNTDTYNKEKLDKTNYFKKYKVKCTVSDQKVINKTSNTAQIQYVIKTQKVSGPGFLDNRTLVVDSMKKINNKWQINSEDIINTEYKDPIYGVVYQNIKASNEKDINAYVKTMDQTNSDTFNNYKDQQLDTFDKYDLQYNLESADITKRSNDDTLVNFTETIVKKDNSDYKNNRTSGVIHLKNTAGTWKITKIDIKKTENLK